jgi:hypothetical protein
VNPKTYIAVDAADERIVAERSFAVKNVYGLEYDLYDLFNPIPRHLLLVLRLPVSHDLNKQN